MVGPMHEGLKQMIEQGAGGIASSLLYFRF
jgi:hypothetical protein